MISDFPEIDVVLLTHDHYDHLDFASFQKLKPKVKQYFVALGLGRHLMDWGIDKNDITEFDWWENKLFANINITFTPSRHFSGRGLRDRFKSLWGGWTLKTENENIYFSGDGGFGNHFKEVGEKLGPFDFGFMECGQYNELWHLMHMYPEESVHAGMEAKVKMIMPVHWGAFSLAMHAWSDPVDRFVDEAIKCKINYIVPRLGDLIDLNQDASSIKWWLDYI